jgi:hypothetical protein
MAAALAVPLADGDGDPAGDAIAVVVVEGVVALVDVAVASSLSSPPHAVTTVADNIATTATTNRSLIRPPFLPPRRRRVYPPLFNTSDMLADDACRLLRIARVRATDAPAARRART